MSVMERLSNFLIEKAYKSNSLIEKAYKSNLIEKAYKNNFWIEKAHKSTQCVHDVMVIIKRNENSNSSSNPVWSYLHFT